MNFTVFIPVSAPGLNQTYKTGKGRFYKSREAKEWQAQAALIIGSEAAIQGWKDSSEFYEIGIEFNNFRQDFDAPIKLITDTVALKLGINDKRIMKGSIEKKVSEQDGVLIRLLPYVKTLLSKREYYNLSR